MLAVGIFDQTRKGIAQTIHITIHVIQKKKKSPTSGKFRLYILASHFYLHFNCNMHYVWITYFDSNTHISSQMKYNKNNQT